MKTKPPQPTHTPTPPWTFQDIEGIRDARGIPVDIRANAAFIVKCVNVHEEMLIALKLARHKIAMWPEGSNPEFFPEIKAIDEAVAKADGK